MRSAVDSSIILDILLDDPQFAEASLQLLETYLARGAVVVSPIAWSESAACLAPPSRFTEVARSMGLIFDPLDQEACLLAAGMWREYRRRGGPRGRILADFLVGAHAQLRADRLLTRDRGFYRSCFEGLEVVEPV